MKIVLAATKREETPELGAMSVASYVHMITRRADVGAVFFPSTYFGLDIRESQKKALRKIATINKVVVGAGYQTNKGYVYALFAENQEIELRENDMVNLEIQGRIFRVSTGELPTEGVNPVVYVKRPNEGKEALEENFPGVFETYFLGDCLNEKYEAIVFQNGKIKCRLPDGHVNFLLKSVPIC